MIKPWEERIGADAAMPKAKLVAMQAEISELRSALMHAELAQGKLLHESFHFGPYIETAGILETDKPQAVVNKLQSAIQAHFASVSMRSSAAANTGSNCE